MSGVGIVRTLLAANAPLVAVVPPARIMAGDLPPNTSLPAIDIRKVSDVSHRHMKMPASGNHWAERVQVTVHAATYPQQRSILALVRAGLPSTRGAVGSYSCDSISMDLGGPDMFDPDASIYSGSQDFIVRYIE